MGCGKAIQGILVVYLREATQATAATAARGAVPHLVGLVRAVQVAAAVVDVGGPEAVVVVVVLVPIHRRIVEGETGLETLRLERHEVAGDEVAGVDDAVVRLGGRGDGAVLLGGNSTHSRKIPDKP